MYALRVLAIPMARPLGWEPFRRRHIFFGKTEQSACQAMSGKECVPGQRGSDGFAAAAEMRLTTIAKLRWEVLDGPRLNTRIVSVDGGRP